MISLLTQVDPSPSDMGSILDIASKIGVIALLLLLGYLVVFSGRLRPAREFNQIEKDRDLARAESTAWKLSYENEVEARRAQERVTTAVLEERTIVIGAMEAIQAIAKSRGG